MNSHTKNILQKVALLEWRDRLRTILKLTIPTFFPYHGPQPPQTWPVQRKASHFVDVTPRPRRSVRRHISWVWHYVTSKIVTFSIIIILYYIYYIISYYALWWRDMNTIFCTGRHFDTEKLWQLYHLSTRKALLYLPFSKQFKKWLPFCCVVGQTTVLV